MSISNSVRLIGNLTADPKPFQWETAKKEKKNGSKYTVAVNEGNGDNAKTQFIDIVNFFGDNDNKFLKKGNLVVVDGSLQIDTYEKDGQKFKSVQVNAENVRYLTPKAQSNKGKEAQEELGD